VVTSESYKEASERRILNVYTVNPYRPERLSGGLLKNGYFLKINILVP